MSKILLFISISMLFLAGCGSTSRNSQQPILVGPVNPEANSSQKDGQNYASLRNADVFLDVVIPPFDPGFPMTSDGKEIDYDELDEKGIWPQLRRTESKLFAVETKKSLDKTGVFSSVRVVPTTNTSADLFVLGTILESDSEVVSYELTVVDSTGEPVGKREFEHEVSENYFRDQRNSGKNPYQPIFNKGRDWVISLLSDMSEEEKQTIKNTTLVRYARYYSPESYAQYLSTDIKKKSGQQYYKFELTGMPSEDDPMMQRISNLRAQELLFVDRLQDQYDGFHAETQDAYYQWQRTTLPELIARREAETERNIKAGIGVGLAVLAGILASNSNNSSSSTGRGATTAGAVLAGIGSVMAVNDAFQNNEEMKVQSAIIQEKGQAVDLSVGPTEMKFADEVIELSGTAEEQYLQWKEHLRKMYELNKTPDVQL